MSVGIFNSEDQSLVKLASNSITADETIETLNDVKVSVATDKASVAADKAAVSADKADIVSMKSEIANTKTYINETAQTISEKCKFCQARKIAIDETKTDIDKKYTEISNTASKLNAEYNNLTSNYYTKEATNSLISSTTKPKYSVVNEFPTSDISTDMIYLKSTNTTSTDGIYEMYTYQDSNWVKIGTSNPDLADYYTKELADSTFATKTEINNTNSNVSQLKEDLDNIHEDLYVKTYNIFNVEFLPRAFIPFVGSHVGELFLDNNDNYSATNETINVLPNTQYTFSNGSESIPYELHLSVIFYDKDMKFLDYVSNTITNSLKYFNFTTIDNTNYLRFQLRSTGKGSDIPNIKKWQLNEGNLLPYLDNYVLN